jgi:hypothetical protein
MQTVDLSGTAFHEIYEKWRRLSPFHHVNGLARPKIDQWYEFFVVEPERLTFFIRRKRLSGGLEVRIDVVQCRFGLREIPLYPYQFYEKLYARVKNKDHRRGMGVLTKHKDFIVEQYRSFLGLCVVPDRGTIGSDENYDC